MTDRFLRKNSAEMRIKMKKQHPFKMYIIYFFTIFMMVTTTKAYAAGTANISVSSASGDVGEQVTVDVNITSDSDIGATKMYISYDANMLEAVAGGDNRGGGTVMWIDTDTYQSKTVSLTFKILKAGTSSVSVSPGSQLADMSEDYMQITRNSGTITGNAPASYSDDNKLSSLEISPGRLSPAFSPDVTSYTATIDSDTQRLTVSAHPNDSKASVSVTGTRMDYGDNTTTITVTAENGSKKSYIIKTYRPEPSNNTTTKTDENNTTQADNPPQEDTNTVVIDGIKYEFDNDFSIHTLPDGFIETTILYNDKEMTAAKGFGERVTLMYLEAASADGKSGFYIYDSVRKSFAPYVEVSQPRNRICFLPITDDMEIPSGYKVTKVQISGQDTQILIGDSKEYYLIYGTDQDGNVGWYCYDNKFGTIQRFFALPDTVQTYTRPDVTANAALQNNSGNRVREVIAIVAVVLALASIAACAYIVINNMKKVEKMKRAMAETLNLDNQDPFYEVESDTIEEEPSQVDLYDIDEE